MPFFSDSGKIKEYSDSQSDFLVYQHPNFLVFASHK